MSDQANERDAAFLATGLDQTTVPTRVRSVVLMLAVCLAGITYLDRVCISLTAPYMMRDLGLSEVQMSLVFSAFVLSYAIFEIPTGWWGDRIGPRRVLTRIVIWWSGFTIATAAAFNYSSLMVIRFLFGAGEAGAWPNSAKAISRWFPTAERGTAQGIFFMGAHLGGGLTPLLVTALLGIMPWRSIFLLFGLIGFVWAAVWWSWFRDEPAEHSAVNQAERDLIMTGRAAEDEHRLTDVPWGLLVTNRSLLALCLMYFTQTYGFYYYITWLPKYLREDRGFSGMQLGFFAGLPLLLSVLADLFGGLTTDWATRRFGLRIGRCAVGGGSLCVAGLAVLAGSGVANPWRAAILISLGGAMANFLLGAAWSVCLDISGRHAGVVTACMNTAGQVGGVLSPIVAVYAPGWFASRSSPLWIVAGLYLLGALCWFFVDPRRRLFDDRKL
ncbi:MFS transporter [Singulisphaera sp. Ch08]|uniref:MFS transporter n=1 Tax=Singulisphaera sp. Ch08 TaxID=3120278 RepID=A0AAU7CI68_9BACT